MSLIAVAVVVLVLVSSCSSLDKDTLEARLLSLPKNAAIAERGLQRGTIRLPAGAADALTAGEALAVWVEVPPADAAAAARRPLVLVHGTPGSLFTWSELVFGNGDFEGIAGRAPIYLLDVVGHGVTRGELEPASFQACADWVAAVIRALGLTDVALVGHSYGGEFVWRAALDHPDLIGRLVLMDSAGYRRADDQWLPEEEAMRDIPGAGFGWLLNNEERVTTALQPHFRASVAGDRVTEMTSLLDNAANWRAMVDLARDENGEREGELRDIVQPTLLIWGADDFAYDVTGFARRFEADIPGARLVTISDSGHYPHEERPRDVARALSAFLGW